MRRDLLFVGALSFVILGGCGTIDDSVADNPEEGTTDDDTGEEEILTDADDDAPTIGMTVINQEALFFTEMVQGAQRAAEDHDVNFTVFNANNNSVDQFNGAEDYISSGVDALIINAIDVSSMEPIVQQAHEADIPVISVDSVIDHEGVDVQVGVNNYDSSVDLGEYFLSYIEEEMSGEEVRLGAVGALNSEIQINRQDGFMDTVLSDDVDLVNTVDGQNVQETAMTASENLLTGNPDMQAAFITGEPAYIGMVAAVRSQNRQDDIKLFGWDLSPQVLQGIDDGFVEAVLQQHPDEYGYAALEAALDLINDEEVEEQIDIPGTVVTSENIDEYRELFE